MQLRLGYSIIATVLAAITLAACNSESGDSGRKGGSGQEEVKSYVIGGVVNGLPADATGLVLLNGEEQLTIPAGEPGFSFNSKVPDGNSYNVTVSLSPEGYECTVEDGSGVVDGKDVAVHVECSLIPYKLGVTVDGLAAGIQVSLQLEAPSLDESPVVQNFSNGDSTFNASLTIGNNYIVTVLPLSEYQCDITAGGSGTVNADELTSVKVSCSQNRYSIGVAVDGLGADKQVSLELKSSGLSEGSVTQSFANESSTFGADLAGGSEYTVTLSQSPAGYQCSVIGGGDGTVSSASVIIVTVECKPEYSIKIAVSGLESLGSQVSVTLDSPSLDGSPEIKDVGSSGLTFDAKLFTGSQYTITVDQTTLGYYCEIGGAGSVTDTVGSANVTVDISCHDIVLGGSVTGLGGNPLKLELTVGSVTQGYSPVVENNRYEFNPAIAFGSHYKVVIQAMSVPNTLECDIKNNEGTITTFNLNELNVTCKLSATATTLSLSGDVTGLKNDGLKLQLAFEDQSSSDFFVISESLSINSDLNNVVRFNFDEKEVSKSARYKLAIEAMPQNQLCEIQKGATGRVEDYNSESVAIYCRSWSHEFIVDEFEVPHSTGEEYFYRIEPRVSVGENGLGHVIWRLQNNYWGPKKVTSWQMARAINIPNATRGPLFREEQSGFSTDQDTYGSQIATDKEGNSVMVWSEPHRPAGKGPFGRRIMSRRLLQDGSSPPPSIYMAADPGTTFSVPQVAISKQRSGSEVFAVWGSYYSADENSAERVGVRRQNLADNATDWDPVGWLDSVYPQHPTKDPHVAVDNQNNAVVVWQQSKPDNSGYGIYADVYYGKGDQKDWLGTRSLDFMQKTAGTLDNVSAEMGHPKVAINNNNQAMAIWEHLNIGGANDGKVVIRTSRYVLGVGQWSAGQDLSLNTRSAYRPAIAVSDSGRAIAVWLQDEWNKEQSVFAAVYDPSADAWGNPRKLGDAGPGDGTKNIRRPQVVIRDNGEAMVVWSELIPEAGYQGYRVLGKALVDLVYPNGKTIPTWISLRDSQIGDSLNTEYFFNYDPEPQIAMDRNGKAMVVWIGDQADNKRITGMFFR